MKSRTPIFQVMLGLTCLGPNPFPVTVWPNGGNIQEVEKLVSLACTSVMRSGHLESLSSRETGTSKKEAGLYRNNMTQLATELPASINRDSDNQVPKGISSSVTVILFCYFKPIRKLKCF